MVAWLDNWDDIAALIRSDPQFAAWSRDTNLYMRLLNRSYPQPDGAPLTLPAYASENARAYAMAYDLANFIRTYPAMPSPPNEPSKSAYMRMRIRRSANRVVCKVMDYGTLQNLRRSINFHGGTIPFGKTLYRCKKQVFTEANEYQTQEIPVLDHPLAPRTNAPRFRALTHEQLTRLFFLLWGGGLRWSIRRQNIGEAICDSCQIGGQLYPCSGCHSVVYCGAECQTRDWHEGGHKLTCK